MAEKHNIDTINVGQRLKAARKKLGFTIYEMHDITGFSKSMISEAENGIKKPSSTYLSALLENFNLNINYIFSGKGKMFIEPEKDEYINDEDSEKIKELIFHLRNVDVLRYSVLSHYSQYKFENQDLIDRILSNMNKNYE